jgi:hypothetical protein
MLKWVEKSLDQRLDLEVPVRRREARRLDHLEHLRQRDLRLRQQRRALGQRLDHVRDDHVADQLDL